MLIVNKSKTDGEFPTLTGRETRELVGGIPPSNPLASRPVEWHEQP